MKSELGSSRRRFLKTAGLGAAAMAAPLPLRLSARLREKRNIVLILTDDLRYDFLGFMGHPFLETPNIDRMAKNGVVFRNGFVTHSLCSPSRATILSGRYSHAHGVLDNQTPLPPRLATYPQELQRAGYRTAYIGKFHMGGASDEPRPGFDHWVSLRGQGVYSDPVFNVNGKRSKHSGYVTDIITDYSKRFIEENRERPFCMTIGHKAVHMEFTPAPRHAGKYASAAIPRPASMADTEANYRGKPEWVRRQRNAYHGVGSMFDHTVASFDDFYRDYCRTALAVDESVGTILGTLEKSGILEDTLVVFTSDNGFMFGEHGLLDKRAMYEPSMRVPMIAHCPGLIHGGQQRREMVLNLDLAPTFVEAAGVPVPPTMQGRSFLPLLSPAAGNPAPWRTEFLYEYFWERGYASTPTVVGLRTDRYSYMRYHGIWDLDELYDIEKDPDQMHNLLGEVRTTTEEGPLIQRIKDPELKALVRDLDRRLFKILQETGGAPEPNWRSAG
ncbi:MAG: sulfatase [Acidobacteria bacterium]|nr:sulfatase [Acidobacteriota bacterium]